MQILNIGTNSKLWFGPLNFISGVNKVQNNINRKCQHGVNQVELMLKWAIEISLNYIYNNILNLGYYVIRDVIKCKF